MIMFKTSRNENTKTASDKHLAAHRDRTRKQLLAVSKHDADFYDMLCQIQDDNTKVIKSDKLEDCECILYDGSNFKYEDGAFLGNTPESVVNLFRYELTWSKDAEFRIEDLKDGTLLIKEHATVESVKAWFKENYVRATVYTANPPALVVILNSKSTDNVDNLKLDVYWCEDSPHANMKNVTIDDLCKEIGLI